MNIKEEKKQHVGLKRDTIDKYYTSKTTVDECVDLFINNINITKEDVIIEPSAGNGAFIERLCKTGCSVLCYDIEPQRKDELSIHINKLNLNEYQKIICLDKIEHKPMVLENKRLNEISITYWDIVDEPKMSSSISLPRCYKKVDELIKSIEKNNACKNINKI